MFFKKQKPKEQEPTNREPANQFYEVLKEKVVAAVGVAYARMDELREQIDKAEQKLSHEVDEAENWRNRIAKLKEVAGDRILESQTSYEKFKVELRKLHGKAEVSDEIIVAVRDEFIPKLKADYDKVHAEFLEKLNDVAKSLRYIGVDAMEKIAKEAMQLFENLLKVQLEYTSVWSKIYKEFNEDFLKMYGASFTLPAILPRSITHDNIVYVQKFLEPERATLNHPLQTRPIEPVPVEPEPVVEIPEEKPAETSVEESPKYNRECENQQCLADFQTTEPDVVFCPKCVEAEVKRLDLVAATKLEQKDAEVKQEDTPAVEKKESISIGPVQNP